MWSFVIRSEEISGRFTASRIICVSVFVQFSLSTSRVLITNVSRKLRFFFKGDRQITRLRANEHVVLRVKSFLPFNVRLFKNVRYSVDAANIRRLVSVLLMGVPTFTLAMEPMFTSRTSAFIGLSPRPNGHFCGVNFHSKGGALQINVFGARGRVSAVLFNG